MKQFLVVLKYEYMSYIKSKSYVLTTVVFAALIVLLSFVPSIIDFFKGEDKLPPAERTDIEVSKELAYISDSTGFYSVELFQEAFASYKWEAQALTADNMQERIANQELAIGVVIEDQLCFKVISREIMSGESMKTDIGNMLTEVYKYSELAKYATDEQLLTIMSAVAEGEVISSGKDSRQNFAIAYILMFVLYFAIIMYGQLVSSAVVVEKTSKTMEVLITTANPRNLIFGKVIGVGLAGISQFLVLILASVFSIRMALQSNAMLGDITDILNNTDMSYFLYATIFFILGYFLYAFLLASFASLTSRVEEAGQTMIPVMMLFIVSFFLAMVGLTQPYSALVTVTSFIPFFTPMVMFMRICMTDIPMWEIVTGISILAVSVYLVGLISAKIYRIGVLMHGKTPKLAVVLKMAFRK